MRQPQVLFLAASVLVAGCAFANPRVRIEQELSTRPSSMAYPPVGVQLVVARGADAVGPLIEIVRAYRSDSIEYGAKRDDDVPRRHGIRMQAIDALGFLLEGGTTAQVVVPVLEGIASDSSDGRARVRVASALACNGTEEGMDALERILQNDRENAVRLNIIGMFGSTPNPRGRERLKQLATSDDPQIRQAVISAGEWKAEYRYVPKKLPAASPVISEGMKSSCEVSPSSIALILAAGLLRRRRGRS